MTEYFTNVMIYLNDYYLAQDTKHLIDKEVMMHKLRTKGAKKKAKK